MRGLRVFLVGRAVEHAAAVREALAEDDALVDELPADVVIVPAEEWADAPTRGRDDDALAVILGGAADAILDPAVDAVWQHSPEREEILALIERARDGIRRRESRALSPALESIVASLETRDAGLRGLLERETATIRGQSPSAIRLGASGDACIDVDDVSVFVDLLRHEVQRARREGTHAILFALEGPDAHGLEAALRPQDVILRRRAEGDLALRSDVSSALVSHARLRLRDCMAVLPDDDGPAMLRRFALRK